MKSSVAKTLVLVSVLLASCLVSAVALAEDISLNNWTVPPYRQTGIEGGLTTMDDISFAHPFVAVAPCRLVDTRQAGFPAGYGTPALVAGVPRNFDLNSQPNCIAAPADVAAYSLNFTVTNTQGPGFLKVFPQGGSVPADISTINYVGGQTIANAAIVPAGTNGGITVIAGVSGTDVIIDINGYFGGESVDVGIPFVWNTSNSGTFGAGIFVNTYTGTSDSFGVVGRANSTGAGTAGVKGTSFNDTAPETWGVWGQNDSSGSDSAGVYGTANLDDDGVTINVAHAAAGVRGVGAVFGVLGIGEFGGGHFALVSAAGAEIAHGAVASAFGADTGGSAPWSFFGITGDIGTTFTKSFIEPHPTDPSKILAYISLEGPEAGTYFRGRGKFQNGTARISVPDHFRMVTDPEGLTVQITPIGAMATVGVMKMDLNEIVVESSRNVEFSYLVQGIRAAFKDKQPIRESNLFAPAEWGGKLPEGLNPLHKQRLIQNGTFNADGTVNMETAKRLGWDKVWDSRLAKPRTQLPDSKP